MPFVPAKCTQCGANIEVDNTKEAAICSFCGTAFITEKAIQNFVTNYNNTYNVTENVTKIIYGNEKDEGSDFFNRGIAHLGLDEFSKAEGCFAKAIELSPANFEYRFYRYVAITQNFTYLRHLLDENEPDFNRIIKMMPADAKANTFSRYGLDGTDEISCDISLLQRAIALIKESGYINTAFLRKFEKLDEENGKRLARDLYDAIISVKEITSADPAFTLTRNIYENDIGYAFKVIRSIVTSRLPVEATDFNKQANRHINKVVDGVLQLCDLSYAETNKRENYSEIAIGNGISSVNVTARPQTGCVFILPPSVKSFKISFNCTLKFTYGCTEEQIVGLLKSGNDAGGVFINFILPSNVTSLVCDRQLTYVPNIISPVKFRCSLNYFQFLLVMDNFVFLRQNEADSKVFIDTLKRLMGEDFLVGKKIFYNTLGSPGFKPYEFAVKNEEQERRREERRNKGFFGRLFSKK